VGLDTVSNHVREGYGEAHMHARVLDAHRDMFFTHDPDWSIAARALTQLSCAPYF
jgi:hypothetical protein